MSRRRHRPDEPDLEASVQAYFATLPVQDKQTYESLTEIAELGASFKDAAAELAGLCVQALGLEPTVELVEVEGGPDGPRYTAVAHLDETTAIFHGHVFRDDERGRESVVLSVALDDEPVGEAEVDWPFSTAYAGGEIWHYRRDEDDEWQRRPDEMLTAFRDAWDVVADVTAARPPLSPLEAELEPPVVAALPSVAELESWPVLEPGLAPDEPLGPGH